MAAAEWQAEREERKNRKGVALQEGDLVLLKRFDVAKNLGMKLETRWEGPYLLTELAYHGKSGRLRDLITGELVRTQRGGLRERVHVNDLKLFLQRDSQQLPVPEPFEANSIEL